MANSKTPTFDTKATPVSPPQASGAQAIASPDGNIVEFSDARFATIFEQSPLSMQVLSTDGRTLHVNRAWEELWGLTLADLTDYNILEDEQLIASGLIEYIRQGFAGNATVIPAVRYDPLQTVHGGRTRWVVGHIFPVMDAGGRVREVVVQHQDITDQREAEEGRRQSEERYKAFMEQSTEAIWRIETETPVSIELSEDEQIDAFYREVALAECNDVMARMYGFERAEEVMGVRLGDFLPRDDPDNVAYLRAFIRSGYRLENAESREIDRDGNTKIFSNNLVGIIENGCLVRAWGTQRDVTENRRAEEALRESEQRFRNMANSAPVLLWIAGTDMLFNWFNKPWLEFTGQTMEHELGKGWEKGVHPEDLEHCLEIYTSAFQARRPFRMELRLLRWDGPYRWVVSEGLPRYTVEGEFFGFIGSCIDITDQKGIEVDLQESQRFLQSSLDSLSAHIAIIDQAGTILAVNAAWRRFAGDNNFIGELCGVGTNYLEVCNKGEGDFGDDAHAVADGIREILDGRRDAYYLEYPCHSPVDERWFGVRVTRFVGEGPVRAVIAHENISERKRVEHALREETEVVETVNSVGQLLAAELDMRKLVQAVTDAASELTDANYCAFFYNLNDENGNTQTFYSLPSAFEEAYPQFPMLRNGDIFGPTYRGEGVIRIDDLLADERYRKTDPKLEFPDSDKTVRSYLAVPVVSRSGEVLGGLFFGHEDVGVFTERSERIVLGLAAQAAVAMDNARLFESLERERARVAASENRYRSLAEATPQILWTSRVDGSIDYFNQLWYDYTGLTPEQSLEWEWVDAIHPADFPPAGEEWKIAYANGENYQIEYRIRRAADGAFRWHLSRAAPLRDDDGEILKWIGTCTDIDDEKRAQDTMSFFAHADALLGSSIEYGETLKNAARLAVPQLCDWCFLDIVEPDGSFERVAVAHTDPAQSRLAQALKRRYASLRTVSHSVTQVALTGKAELKTSVSDQDVIGIARDAEHLAMLRAVGMKSFMCVPLIASRPEGTSHPLGTITFISAESGRVYDHADMARAEEIARRAALAVDNARLFQEAQQARDNAETANRAKDEFLATISHELRTPLTAALGWSYLLRSSKLDAETAARALDTIERNIKAQAQIVEDLLDVSRIISGKLSLDVRPLDLRTIIEAAMDTVRPAAEAKGITLRTEFEEGPGPISGDPNRLQQVIWNLLSNAVKFTPKGGDVSVQLRQVDSHMAISVTDTGMGIAAEFLPFVFERFRQADATSTRRYGGLGLGLSIVRHLVELHGGTVEVDSPGEERGSIFTVKLPLLAVQMREADTIIREPSFETETSFALSNVASLQGLRVLVVEDEADARELISTVLEQFGAQVRNAPSAAEGFSVLRVWRPDVLVSDIGMPNEDGFGLIARVRSLTPEEGGATPAVALTAYARAQDRLRTLSAGYQVHVPKPVEPEELAAAVGSLAGRRSGEAVVE